MNLKQIHQNGRSMIEMLGVLAIVGILSVGGISAFHKAMTRYEANKWGEDMQSVTMNFVQYAEEWKRIAREKQPDNKQGVGVTKYVYDAGLVPPRIKDSVSGFASFHQKIYFSIHIKTGDAGFQEKCLKLFNQVLMPQNEIIVTVHRYGKKKDNGSAGVNHIYYDGNANGGKCTRNCLKNFTFNDIINACRYYEEETDVTFSIYFK